MLLTRISHQGVKRVLTLIVISACCVSCDSENEGNRVLIGNSNILYDLDQLQYQEQFVVQVSDPDGGPSPNTIVTLKLTPVSYNKGLYVPTDIDLPPDGTVDRWVPDLSAVCASEDTNDNGALDAGEDTNNNGFLDPDVPTLTAHPEKTPTIAPGSNIVLTDDNGFGYFAITYPKSEALWSSILVTAEASDGLAGNTATYNLDLRVLIKDISDLTIDPPGGDSSPYGTAANCADPG
ncbi:MAG: hypothetical protein WBO16_11205 [Gammaproteobacteria bacterium]|jgi:hypothetical protein